MSSGRHVASIAFGRCGIFGPTGHTSAVAPPIERIGQMTVPSPHRPSAIRATLAAVRFTSLEAGAKLLSAKNRELLRLIVTRAPRSVAELAVMAHRAPHNVERTLHRLSTAGIVSLNRGDGRAVRPTLAARKVHIEIDLVQEI